jgi:hypothetical protein
MNVTKKLPAVLSPLKTAEELRDMAQQVIALIDALGIVVDQPNLDGNAGALEGLVNSLKHYGGDLYDEINELEIASRTASPPSLAEMRT